VRSIRTVLVDWFFYCLLFRLFVCIIYRSILTSSPAYLDSVDMGSMVLHLRWTAWAGHLVLMGSRAVPVRCKTQSFKGPKVINVTECHRMSQSQSCMVPGVSRIPRFLGYSVSWEPWHGVPWASQAYFDLVLLFIDQAHRRIERGRFWVYCIIYIFIMYYNYICVYICI